MSSERFSRIERMVGPEGLRRLASAHVTVVGLGAVGGYAVEALARAGVGRLRLVDCDIIRPSNFNRQIHALESTLGLTKAEAARRRVLDINPDCIVEPLEIFAHLETLDRILRGPPDLLVDAIDSVGPKVELIGAALRRHIPLVSCMGAALRTDPARLRTAPLSQTRSCPFAKQIRKRLRQEGLPVDFPCVYSDEPVHGLPEEAIDRTGAHAEEVLERGRRRRTLGSLPTLTGIFGLVTANLALKTILGELFPGSGPEQEMLRP